MQYHWLIFYHVQEWQREQEQLHRLLTEVRKVHRIGIWQHILGYLRAFFRTPDASKQKYTMPIPLEGAVSQEEKLTQHGFTTEEIIALDRFRQWYQTDGREDIVIQRRWKFLKLLVNNGTLEP